MGSTEPSDVALERTWLTEQGADLRTRPQAEYAYTVSAVVLFIGVGVWVAGQRHNHHNHRSLVFLIAAALVVVVFGCVAWKISENHRAYKRIWKARRNTIDIITGKVPGSEKLFASIMKHRKPGRGWLLSIFFLGVVALGSIIVCLRSIF